MGFAPATLFPSRYRQNQHLYVGAGQKSSEPSELLFGSETPVGCCSYRWGKECPEKPGRLRCGGFPPFFSTDESLTFVHTVGSKGDSKRAKIAPTTITNKEHALAGLKIYLAMLLVEEQVEKETSQPTAPGGNKM